MGQLLLVVKRPDPDGPRHLYRWVSLFVGLDSTVGALKFPNYNLFTFPSWDHDQNVKDAEAGGIDSQMSSGGS